jgi:GcrA cell cycle regulator
MMPSWPPERVETLRRLWAEGLSAAQVAERLGVTRGAVTGKVARLGLQGRASTAKANSIRRRRAASPAEPDQPQARDDRGHLASQPLPPAHPEDVPTVTLLDADAGHCRWPCASLDAVSQGRPFFCGKPRLPGLSWCEAHAARALATPRLPRTTEPAPVRELEPATA